MLREHTVHAGGDDADWPSDNPQEYKLIVIVSAHILKHFHQL